MTGTYISLVFLWLIVFLLYWQRKKALRHRAAALHRNKGGKPIMEEVIRKYMDTEVWVTTINDTLLGRLTHYADGWITLTNKKGKEECVNVDYIVKIKAAK